MAFGSGVVKGDRLVRGGRFRLVDGTRVHGTANGLMRSLGLTTNSASKFSVCGMISTCFASLSGHRRIGTLLNVNRDYRCCNRRRRMRRIVGRMSWRRFLCSFFERWGEECPSKRLLLFCLGEQWLFADRFFFRNDRFFGIARYDLFGQANCRYEFFFFLSATF